MDESEGEQSYGNESFIQRNSDWDRSLIEPPKVVYRVGVYGWRKRCLYFSIVLLICLSIINFTLIAWIIRVMQLNWNGIGTMYLHDWGVEFKSDVQFNSILYANRLKPIDSTKDLKLDSAKRVILQSKDLSGKIQNRLIIGDDSITAKAKHFVIENLLNKTLYSVNSTDVVFGAESLRITGELGAIFEQALKTNQIISDSNLKINSSKGININGNHIKINSDQIQMLANDEIILQSEKLSIQASQIQLKNLPVSSFYPSHKPSSPVLQVCVCGNNGKLYLAHGMAKCQAFKKTCEI